MLPKYKRREAAPNNQAELTVPQHFRSIRFEKQFPRLSMAQNEHFPIMTPASAIRQTGWNRGCALNDTKKQFRRLLLANHRSQARERTPSGNSATRHVAGVSGIVPNALLFDFFFLLPTLVQWFQLFQFERHFMAFFLFSHSVVIFGVDSRRPVVILRRGQKEEPRMFSETSRGN